MKSSAVVVNGIGRRTEWDDSFWYKTDEIKANFTDKSKMHGMQVYTPKYATELGLRVGDSKEKMIQLYGDDYTMIDNVHFFWYIYDEGKDLDISFRVENGKIEEWDITIPSMYMGGRPN